MTHDDWVKWTDQIENSLVRAEKAGKDKDIIVLLRLAYQIGVEHIRGTKEEKKNANEKG